MTENKTTTGDRIEAEMELAGSFEAWMFGPQQELTGTVDGVDWMLRTNPMTGTYEVEISRYNCALDTLYGFMSAYVARSEGIICAGQWAKHFARIEAEPTTNHA
jgi:hypothetical protein